MSIDIGLKPSVYYVYKVKGKGLNNMVRTSKKRYKLLSKSAKSRAPKITRLDKFNPHLQRTMYVNPVDSYDLDKAIKAYEVCKAVVRLHYTHNIPSKYVGFAASIMYDIFDRFSFYTPMSYNFSKQELELVYDYFIGYDNDVYKMIDAIYDSYTETKRKVEAKSVSKPPFAKLVSVFSL